MREKCHQVTKSLSFTKIFCETLSLRVLVAIIINQIQLVI